MLFSLFFCWNIALGSVLPVNTHTTHTTHTIAICVAQITQSPFVCSIRNMYNVDRLLHLQSVLVASASSLLLCICAVCTRERARHHHRSHNAQFVVCLLPIYTVHNLRSVCLDAYLPSEMNETSVFTQIDLKLNIIHENSRLKKKLFFLFENTFHCIHQKIT